MHNRRAFLKLLPAGIAAAAVLPQACVSFDGQSEFVVYGADGGLSGFSERYYLRGTQVYAVQFSAVSRKRRYFHVGTLISWGFKRTEVDFIPGGLNA